MTGISTLGQSLLQVDRLTSVQEQLSLLQQQLTTGKKASLFQDLENDVLTSQRARADFSELDTYLNNMQHATRRMNLMNVSMDQIRKQSQNLQNAFTQQTQEGEIEIRDIANLSRNMRDLVVDLVNAQDGSGRYLFAGSDTNNQPITMTGSLDAFMANDINDWFEGNIDTDALLARSNDSDILTDTVMGYSLNLSSGTTRDVTVRVDDSSEINYTVLANNEAFRDILNVTTMISQLEEAIVRRAEEDGDPETTALNPGAFAPGADAEEQNDNFYELYNSLRNKLSTLIDNLDNEQFTVAQAQVQMNAVKESHQLQQNVLLDQISNVEDADMNQVALQLNALQTQLEASYRVTASIRQLSLVNFI